MLKDNADDIREKILHFDKQKKHPVIVQIAEEAKAITSKYVSNKIEAPARITYKELSEKIDVAFIALHGRPGEDGAVQQELEKYNVPYNGSGIESSQVSINKFDTNRILRNHGLKVANHLLVYEKDWHRSSRDLITEIEKDFSYPFIAKPADDGCSSAVKKIKNSAEFSAFCKLIFGEENIQDSESARILNLKYNEEFPRKKFFLIEDLISKGNAKHFLEVTGGLLTRYSKDGKIEYEIFEPSETLATGDILSLEEKFLAGEGQNITPARFSKDITANKKIAEQVREELKKVAEIIHIEGYARIDAFVRIFEDNTSETIIIEVNSLPGMTPATCIFHQTAINGYKPYDFIDNILSFGIQRQKYKFEKELK
jgi:UDP-N-acetylmuramate--alanine ligase